MLLLLRKKKKNNVVGTHYRLQVLNNFSLEVGKSDECCSNEFFCVVQMKNISFFSILEYLMGTYSENSILILNVATNYWIQKELSLISSTSDIFCSNIWFLTNNAPWYRIYWGLESDYYG